MVEVRMSPAQLRCNAAWLRDQIAELTGWITGNPHRWPHIRVTTALQAITAGDEHWRMKAAEVLR